MAFGKVEMEVISFGQCSVCRQGELIAMKHLNEPRLLVVCDDCESQWKTPQDAESYRNVLKDEIKDIIPASSQDIVEIGWK